MESPSRHLVTAVYLVGKERHQSHVVNAQVTHLILIDDARRVHEAEVAGVLVHPFADPIGERIESVVVGVEGVWVS